MNLNKIAAQAVSSTSEVLSKANKINNKMPNAGKTIIHNAALNGMEALSNQNKVYIKAAQNTGNAICKKIEQLKLSATEIIEDEFTLPSGIKAKFDIFFGTQAGSNKGFYALNKETGELFYAKFGKQCDFGLSQPETEVFTSKVYNMLGINVPDMQLVKNKDGEVGLISKYIPDLHPVNSPNSSVNEGFGADVFLANWDAVVSNNTQSSGQKLYRIDFGGAMNYRAQGGSKTFGYVVDELTTMIDPKINPEAANLFSTMTREQLIKSLEKVVSLDKEGLIKLALEYGCEKSVCDTLLKRQEFLSYALEVIKNTPQGNQTMLEYLGNVKTKVLESPLSKFEHTKIHPELQNKNIIKHFGEKIKDKLPINAQDKDYSDIVQNMIYQREKLNSDMPEMYINKKLLNIKDCYGFVNDDLRNKRGATQQIQELDDIISKNMIPRDITLYRGATPQDFGHDCSRIDSQEFLDAVYKKGDCFTIPIFPNTTLDKKIGEKFANPNSGGILFKINAPKGTNGVYMEKLPGSEICEDLNEEEIILARDLIYKFKKRIPYFGRDLVEVDILDKAPNGVTVHNFEKELFDS